MSLCSQGGLTRLCPPLVLSASVPYTCPGSSGAPAAPAQRAGVWRWGVWVAPLGRRGQHHATAQAQRLLLLGANLGGQVARARAPPSVPMKVAGLNGAATSPAEKWPGTVGLEATSLHTQRSRPRGGSEVALPRGPARDPAQFPHITAASGPPRVKITCMDPRLGV